MHEINFIELSKNKILEINDVIMQDAHVIAVLTTSQFNRVTTKPYKLAYDNYLKSIEQMIVYE